MTALQNFGDAADLYCSEHCGTTVEIDLRLERAEKAAAAVMTELVRATGKHGRFNSPHEAYAILLEEVDELWDDIKKNRHSTAYIEAIQVAAMAIRFVVDCGLWDANGDLIDPSQF